MFNSVAKTLSRAVELHGRGLHGGRMCTVRLSPSSGRGWVLEHEGTPVGIGDFSAPGGRTTIGPVDTVEHLFAALWGRGVTDVHMAIEGGEVPALDGSARPWLQGWSVVDAGTTHVWRVSERVEVACDGGWAVAEPSEVCSLAVEVDFGPSCRGRWEGSLTDFEDELSWARTFLPHSALERIHRAGRGRGIGPGDVVILGPRGPLVPERGPDECVRHKALDLVGDLALLGRPALGRFTVHRGTHRLHQQLVRAVRASWR